VQKEKTISPVAASEYSLDPSIIGFRNAVFTWSNDIGETSGRHYRLKIDGELFFKPGRLNLIVGPTGSGKTSLLMALLGI